MRKIKKVTCGLLTMFFIGMLSFTTFAGEQAMQGEIRTNQCSVESASSPLNGARSSAINCASDLKGTWGYTKGGEAIAISKATINGVLTKMNSIYARASVVYKDGSATTKKKTNKNASSCKSVAGYDGYTTEVLCFKSGHQFKHTGYNTVTKRLKLNIN